MAIDATTDSNLRDYEEQLNKLDSDDIRIPNQSLILDYFCTDHELTDFLREKVFLESSIRHTTWRKVNKKACDEAKKVNDDEISLLLDSGDNFSARVWANIISLTASRQAHQYLVDSINRAFNNGQPVDAGYEQSSEDRDREHDAETNKKNIEGIKNETRTQIHSNVDSRSRIQQRNKSSAGARNPGDPAVMIVAAFALLGALTLAVTTQNYENASTSDSPVTAQSLRDLEAKQQGAVLMCEHQPIIDKATTLKLVEPQNIRRRDVLITSSNKQIEFLNQKSAQGFKYWEDPSCTWGAQWFDKNTADHARLFLAVSRKCAAPVVHYQYAKDKSNKNIISTGEYNAYGHSIGEIRIPFIQEYSYLFVEKVTCS